MAARLIAFLVETHLLLVWTILFGLLATAGECGFRLGHRPRAQQQQCRDTERTGVSTLTASMSALLAFTLGLTISFAESRFETRRDLVVQEANTIGTAWLRARLTGEPEGVAIAALIEEYAKVRLDFVTGDKQSEVAPLLSRTNALQAQMWRLTTDLARRTPTPITGALIAALNDMFDASVAQRFAYASRIPTSLALAILVGSMLTVGAMGYLLGGTGNRQAVLSILSLLMWAGAIVLIIDFNRPRLGSIRVDSAPLVWTIEGFGSGTR